MTTYANMGLAKTEHFSFLQNELARISKALAHPARIAILGHLLEVNQCVGNDIVSELPLAQPTISRHLKELKDIGLIKGTIDGNHVRYCINKQRFEEVQKLFADLFDSTVIEQKCE